MTWKGTNKILLLFFLLLTTSVVLLFFGLQYIKAALNPGSEWSLSISSPVGGETAVSITPTLMWNFYSCDSDYTNGDMSPASCNGYSPCHDQYPVAAASARMAATIASYTLQIDDDINFGSVNYTKNGGAEYQHTVTSPISYNTAFYWRINAVDNYGSTNGEGTTCYVTSGAFYTIASTPATPIVNGATKTTLNVNPERISGGGESEMAIFMADSAANCNGTVTATNKYINSDGSQGSSAVWQAESAWGTKTITGLSEGTTYYFCAKARNLQNIETSFSSAAGASTVLNEPSNVAVAYANDDSCYNVFVSWTDNSSMEDGYKVEVASSTNLSYWAQACSTVSDAVSCIFHIGDTTPTYYFRVKAFKTSPSTESIWAPDSSGVSHSPDYCAPVLALGLYSCDRVNMSWVQDGGTPDSFNILRSVNGGTYTTISNVSGSTLNFVDYNILTSKIYRYQIETQIKSRKSNIIEVTPCPRSSRWKETKDCY